MTKGAPAVGDAVFHSVSASVMAQRRFWINWAVKMGVARGDAEDVLQDALLKAWLTRQRCRAATEQEGMAWFAAILRNTALDHIRRRALRQRHTNTYELTSESVYPSYTPDLTAGLTLAEIRCQMPPEHWESLRLRAAGYSISEIAAAFGVKEGTVKSWLHRGAARAARYLRTDDPDTELRAAV